MLDLPANAEDEVVFVLGAGRDREHALELSVDGVPERHGVVAFPADGRDRRVVVRLGSKTREVPPWDETIGLPHAAPA